MIKPGNSAARDFLHLWAPEGPWVLTCISTDRKGIDTHTFHTCDLEAMEEWLLRYNGQRNVYFHVNPCTRDVTKKAEREDVAALAWLHVDIDPRAGEDIDEEQTRALGLLTDRLPEGVPEPTCIIFSGGGYQAFWRLEEPVQVDGDLAKAEQAKLYNLQLETLFRADNCHNIDRIMRLPGTVNIPDAKKRKKGRTEVLAELVSFKELSYSISVFKPAPAVQTPNETGFGGAGGTVDIGGDVERVQDLSELDEWSVSDRVKVAIAQGRHPDEPLKNDNSRSAWLFYVCCGLVRAEVPVETIYAIITDPEWGISESVLELKSNAHKYAIRQIGRAKEHAVDPALDELNSRFAVVETIGGKCRIVEEVMDEALDRPRLTLQSFEDFRNRYMHQSVQIGVDGEGKPQFMPKGKWWLLHKLRRQFRTVVFAPGKDTPGSYNMWKGFGCESIPGDCTLFLDHVRRNICSGDEELYTYVVGWMARMMQEPGTPGEVAIVLRGGRGTGKSFFAVQLGKLLGRHFLHVSNSSHLTGNFNSHLRDLVLLFGDEAFYAGDKRHASILKTLITESTLTIERKGVDVETAPNYIHLIMASNDMHVVPAGGDERRYMVLDVGTGNQQDTQYFSHIARAMDEGGREALLHYLLNYDLSEYEVRNVPKTKALHEQKLLSLDPEHEWWYQKLFDGQILPEANGWPAEIPKEGLVQDYTDHTRRFNITRRGNQTALGRFLKHMCPKLQQVKRTLEIERVRDDGWSYKKKVRAYCYVMPTLKQARERWEELHGREDWPDPDDQEDLDLEEPSGTPF